MKDKQFRNLIENAYPDQKQAMYEDLKKELNLPDDNAVAPVQSHSAAKKPASKWRTSFKHFFKKPARLAACVSAATAVVCLAIMLPFTLNNDGGLQATTPNPNPNPPQTSVTTDRFIKAEECEEIEIEYSVKEYSEFNHLSLLYVDWYDVADIMTSLHVNKEDSTDIIYYEEILQHKYTGSIVELYITDLNTKVDKVEVYKNACYFVYILKPAYFRVFLGSITAEDGERYTYTANFTYGKYEYTLVLRYPMGKNDIFELVYSMLPI